MPLPVPVPLPTPHGSVPRSRMRAPADVPAGPTPQRRVRRHRRCHRGGHEKLQPPKEGRLGLGGAGMPLAGGCKLWSVERVLDNTSEIDWLEFPYWDQALELDTLAFLRFLAARDLNLAFFVKSHFMEFSLVLREVAALTLEDVLARRERKSEKSQGEEGDRGPSRSGTK